MEEPPPIVTIPSQPPARKASVASRTAASVGLGGLRSNQVISWDAGRALTTWSAIPVARTPGSVTISGRLIPHSASASPISCDAPKPNEAVVRYRIVAMPSIRSSRARARPGGRRRGRRRDPSGRPALRGSRRGSARAGGRTRRQARRLPPPSRRRASRECGAIGRSSRSARAASCRGLYRRLKTKVIPNANLPGVTVPQRATAGPGFSPARRLRMLDDVFVQIRDAILAGEVGEGQRLPNERDLAERFAVGRPTVREALRSLEALGIVEIRAGRAGGAFAARPSEATLGSALSTLVSLRGASAQELAEFRLGFEAETAWWAARRADGSDVDELA